MPEWFNRIRTGQIRLPRFQRFEAWGHNEISNLIEAVLNGLPAGSTLVLELGSEEPFISRQMIGSPDPVERPTEHLLDGQQRLTALWRSFHDDYENRTYLLSLEPDEEHGGVRVPRMHSQARWSRNGKRYPVWADDPVQVWGRGFIPLRLLRPGDIHQEIGRWCDSATTDDVVASRALERQINALRESIAAYNIPFLALPSETPRDVALNVFVKLNTTSVRLTAYDIIVAQLEAATGQSLHDLIGEVHAAVPMVGAYIDAEDLVLDTAALRDDRAPTQASYFKLDLDRVVNEWSNIAAGIRWAISFLEDESVYDGRRLPTTAVLPILSALHPHVPEDSDEHGKARSLLRSYVWRSFLTSRYENQAATRQLQDLRGLRARLRGEDAPEAPIFNEDLFPLPTVEVFKRAGWPSTKEILARGILAVSLRAGGRDIADDTPATREQLPRREYHHLFPNSLLVNQGQVSEAESFRALNCALITWKTNRDISAKEPVRYLRDRIDRGDLSEQDLANRLATHVIPYDQLNVGGYSSFADETERADHIRADYGAFIDARAELIAKATAELCKGRRWPS
ncbi:MAG: DUF262 domain-containing protein [Acidimicrobiia bacterium]|nr:DUF262 domain-containing protein [Acidimicrobiia bacterium]